MMTWAVPQLNPYEWMQDFSKRLRNGVCGWKRGLGANLQYLGTKPEEKVKLLYKCQC